jgi:hypothetical protein
MNTITKKYFCVLFPIKLTLKLYVNIIMITNSVYFVYSVVNKIDNYIDNRDLICLRVKIPR